MAVGLLTRRDLNLLGPTFSRVWPLEELHAQDLDGDGEQSAFADLIRAIDDADEELQQADEARS